ncbi:MAG: DEAD/DEAH box helicase [Flavobacteriaceae bacterium]|nr:DEAD/DEAH box helicase [Flavobacteriaceae bacterium]
MTFKSLGLSDTLLQAIDQKGYAEPTTIQEKAIPLILEGKDVLASAQTGTGKTAGFTLPMLQLLTTQSKWKRRPLRALVLTPTRELAAQVYNSVLDYGEGSDIRSTVIFGGVNQKPQVSTLRNGVDILVATPGRLLDLHNQKALSLARIEIFVLDEADRMLDMGFLRDIKKVISLMPAKRQNLLFSATFSKEIRKLAGEILNHPVPVEAAPENTTADKVNQKVYRVDKAHKTALAIHLIAEGNWEQVLVFTRTKHGANKLCKKMIGSGISAAAIHGNKSQSARTKALDGFKKGEIRVLVATDIAARGLDIPLLPHVVNFELPNVPEDYVHRIGRTGRAGASGEAISLVSGEEKEYLRDIEKLLGQRVDSEIVKGFEPDTAPVKKTDTPKKSQHKNSKRKDGKKKFYGGAKKNKRSTGFKPKNKNQASQR